MQHVVNGRNRRQWNHHRTHSEEEVRVTQDRPPTNVESPIGKATSSSIPVGGCLDIEMISGLVGRSPAIRHVHDVIRCVARTETTVLLRGESGTGKEVAARAIHQMSARAVRPFVTVHCAALSEGLLESELFGHERGAFTGAVTCHRGRFELADGGTLFLDEIGEISPAIQVKLLRVLQEQTFERVGGETSITVNIRLIAATNQDLEKKINVEKFREDLYYRLNVVPIWLPPLRERREDIPLLVAHFLTKYGEHMGRICTISGKAMEALLTYSWPGNVRELENVIQRALTLTSEPVIGLNDLQLSEGVEGNHTIQALLGWYIEHQIGIRFPLDEEAACNRNCKHCMNASGRPMADEMSREEVMHLWHQGIRSIAVDVAITGGEPLLRSETLELISSSPRWQRLVLRTNGILVDEHIAEALVVRSPRVVLSLDGPSPETCDYIRGRGSFAAVEKAVSVLRNKGLPVGVSCTVTRMNYDLIEATVQTAARMGFKSISFGVYHPGGRFDEHASQMRLSLTEMANVHRCLQATEAEITISSDFSIYPEFERILDGLVDIPELETAYNRPISVCELARSALTVRPDTQVIGCNVAWEDIYGSLRGVTLNEFWHENPKLKYYRKLLNIPKINCPWCADCPYVAICPPGCRANAIAVFGNILAPDPMLCLRILENDNPCLPWPNQVPWPATEPIEEKICKAKRSLH